MPVAAVATRRPRKRPQAAPLEPLDLRCDVCGADAVVVEPGSEDVHELFLLAHGTLMRRWCLEHWIAAFAEREVVARP
jgi:hypothetical protein